MITVLAGGVGAARFLQGLLAVHPPSDLTIVSNVGDDAQFFGLHVSPDIDIVLYHLAGLADEQRGFGLRDDTSHTLDALAWSVRHCIDVLLQNPPVPDPIGAPPEPRAPDIAPMIERARALHKV